MNKIRVAVLFGGVSSEHEVSRRSCCLVLDHIDREKYDVYPIGITKGGDFFYYQGDSAKIPGGEWESDINNRPVLFSLNGKKGFSVLEKDSTLTSLEIDVVFPVLHGKNGEDGTLQGMLMLAGLPFVGSDARASALTMDKIYTHIILENAGIPMAKWDYVKAPDLGMFDEIEMRLSKKLGYPMFVKPANAGSSGGVTKATDKQSLKEGILVALKEDDKVLIEEAIDGIEIECAALGTTDDAFISCVGEIESANEFYDYEAKYLNEASKVHIPARISEAAAQTARAYAKRAFSVLGCYGLSRIDSFVTRKEGRVILNEVNTLPGFTSISMYPMLIEHSGKDNAQMVDALIQLALNR